MNIVMIDNDYCFCDKLAKTFKSNGDFNVIANFNNFNDALTYIKENKSILELIIVDLEVTNVDIDILGTTISENCNIIVMSELQDTIDRFLNYPYFQRIFKKPISYSAILNYVSIQNNIETYDNYKKKILKTLSKLGFNIKHAGTTYLAEATILAVKNKIKKLSDIYMLLAYNHDTDPKIIGWSINNAINKVIKCTNPDDLYTYFNITANQKLTAKAIISHFSTFDSMEKI